MVKQIWKIVSFTSELWRYYVSSSALTICVSLLALLQPLFSGWAIDEIRQGTGARVSFVVVLALLIFASDLLSNLLNNLNGFLGDRLGFKIDRLLSRRYFEHILSLPQSFYDNELTGKIVNRLNRSVSQLSDYVNMLTNNFLQFITSTVLSLVVVAYYSWPVALMLASLYPIYIFMTTKTSNKWMDYQAKMNEHKDIAAGRFSEVINQIKVVKSFNQEERELGHFNKHRDKVVDIERPQSKLWHVSDIKRRLILNVIFLMVYLYIFVQAVHGQFSPGQAVTLILYAMQIRMPIFTISFLVDRSQRAVADSRDYFEIMALKPQAGEALNASELVVNKGQIEFQNVSFGYSHGSLVLKELTFKIEPGSRVALVGESGEGKTTITNLLMRLYQPNSGQILIDGQSNAEVSQASLRHNIAVVFQDPALFSGTIKENIAYANPKADLEQIVSAARAANADEFITKFEKGYEAEIGEHGLKLSGGQKQRIAIARALLKDAPILVLDEATSSLDSKSEAAVQTALENLMKDRTTIIIAHRLSTIQSVDKIITLKNGRVDEVGSPTKLAKTKGIYAELLKLQQRPQTEATKQQLKDFDLTT